MPEEGYWESLFNVPLILDRLGLNVHKRDVVELGCGYGTFTIAAARRIRGCLTTYDIDPEMIERTRERAHEADLQNVVCELRDVMLKGFSVPRDSQDACLLFNILHTEEPVPLLEEAGRILRPEGQLMIIHWQYDRSTPRGPALAIRPKPQQCEGWARQAGFRACSGPIDLPPFHFGLVMTKFKNSDSDTPECC